MLEGLHHPCSITGPITVLSLAVLEAINLGLLHLAKPPILVPQIIGCIVLHCGYGAYLQLPSSMTLVYDVVFHCACGALCKYGVYMHMLLFIAGGGDVQRLGHIMVQIKCVGVLLGQALLLTWQCKLIGYYLLKSFSDLHRPIAVSAEQIMLLSLTPEHFEGVADNICAADYGKVWSFKPCNR